MSRLSPSLPDAVHRELVQTLFTTLPPTVIMSGLFLAVGVLAGVRTHDGVLIALVGIGAVLSLGRMAFVMQGQQLVRHHVERDEMERLERRFGATYLPFGLALGLFSARVLQLPVETLHTLAAVLIAGYAAGVAAGVYVRPWIAVPSILFAVVPPVVVTALAPLDTDRLLALVLAAFTWGGIGSSMRRYRSDAAKIEQRHRLAAFSRQDSLTSLPNRLALIEEFDLSGERRDKLHSDWLLCIDLDGFTALNRQHGQTVGDALLRMAAARLSVVVGERGLPARLGRDEFCVLQHQPEGVEEVDWLARRIVRELSEPCLIEGRVLRVSASVGYIRAVAGSAFGALVEGAEAAMREVRMNGGSGVMEARPIIPDLKGFGFGGRSMLH